VDCTIRKLNRFMGYRRLNMRTRLIILGLGAGAVVALIVGLSVLNSLVFKQEIDPSLQSHFSSDKQNWWEELPIKVIPARSGIYNLETQGNEKDELKLLTLGKSVLGELPVSVSHPEDSTVELVLSKEILDCGVTTDVLTLKHRGYADVNGDGTAEECIFIGRANTSESCAMGSGNSLGYGGWYVFGKDSIGTKVELRQVRKADCGS
jgi:hypothetical protein